MPLRSIVAVALLFTGACGGCEDEAPDLRFHTPRATIRTLLDVYGVADVSEEEIQRRMQQNRRFQLQDPDTFHACFSDFAGPEDEGLAGYVFGSLAAAKDHLRITLSEDEATVMPQLDGGPGRPVVLERDGANWRIVLRRSVPSSVQRRLRAVYRRAEARRHEGTGQ